GTMFAVIVYFWRAWAQTFFHSQAEFLRFTTKIIIATVLTGAIGYGLKVGIEKSLDPGYTKLVSWKLATDNHQTPTSDTQLQNIVSADLPSLHLFNPGESITLSPTRGGDLTPSSSFTVKSTSTLANFMAFLEKGLAIESSSEASSKEKPGVSLHAITENA